MKYKDDMEDVRTSGFTTDKIETENEGINQENSEDEINQDSDEDLPF